MTDRAMLEIPAPAQGTGFLFEREAVTDPAGPHLLGLERHARGGAAGPPRRRRPLPPGVGRARYGTHSRAGGRRGVQRVLRGLDPHARARSSSPSSGWARRSSRSRRRDRRSPRARRCSTRCASIASMGVDLVVVRHVLGGRRRRIWPATCAAAVINAGDGAHEHPTQGLLDLLTLRDAWNGRFEGRRLAIVGDIAHSRVARSAIFGLTALGAHVTLAGPATLMPAGVEALGVDDGRDRGRRDARRRRRDGAAPPARAHGRRACSRRSASTRGCGASTPRASRCWRRTASCCIRGR